MKKSFEVFVSMFLVLAWTYCVFNLATYLQWKHDNEMFVTSGGTGSIASDDLQYILSFNPNKSNSEKSDDYDFVTEAMTVPELEKVLDDYANRMQKYDKRQDVRFEWWKSKLMDYQGQICRTIVNLHDMSIYNKEWYASECDEFKKISRDNFIDDYAFATKKVILAYNKWKHCFGYCDTKAGRKLILDGEQRIANTLMKTVMAGDKALGEFSNNLCNKAFMEEYDYDTKSVWSHGFGMHLISKKLD